MSFIKKIARGILPSRVLGMIRTYTQDRHLKSFQTRVVEHSYGGLQLKVYLADGLGQGWYDQDWEPLPELKFLGENGLRPGCLVFDLGAHQSVIAIMIANMVDGGKVIAVEANPHNVAVSQKNLELNQVRNVLVEHAAIAGHEGELTFNRGLNGRIANGEVEWGEFTIRSTTIDRMCEVHGIPDVVFIDIEGAECDALGAASKPLAKGVPFFVEVHVNEGLEKLGGSVAQVVARFPEKDYRLYGRSEEMEAFRPLDRLNDPLFEKRFFMIAVPTKKNA